MSQISGLFRKVYQNKLSVVGGWLAFFLGQGMSPDLLLAKISLLSIARILP